MAQANVKLTVDSSQATRALKGVQPQPQKLNTGVNRLKTAVAGIGFTVLARQATTTASNFQALQLRMKVLTSEFGEFAQAQELVRKAQDRFNLSILEATKGVTDIFARLRPLGISLKDIETTFIGFNTIAKLAGLNATEASAAFTQLAQGLGSGRLQGDEFRSIAEQVPQLLKAISDETGVASGKLKDFASKGLLTADVVLRALAKSAEEGADKIGAIMDASPAEVFKAFINAVFDLQVSLGNKLLPGVLIATKGMTAFVEGIVSFVDSEAGQVTFAFVGIAAAIKGVSVVVPILIAQVTTLKATFATLSIAAAVSNGTLATTTSMTFLAAGGFAKATAAATAFKIALAKTGIGLVVVGLGFLATALLKANNAQKEFNKLLKEGTTADINEQLKITTTKINNLRTELENVGKGTSGKAEELRLNRQLDKAIEQADDLKKALEDAENRELTREFNMQLENLKNQNAELTKSVKRSQIKGEEKKKEFDLNQQILEIEKQFSGEEKDRLISLAKQNHDLQNQKELIDKNVEAAKELKKKFDEIGQSVENNIVQNLTDAVMGAQSLGEALNNVLRSLQRQLVEMAIQNAVGGFGQLFSGFLGNIFGGGGGLNAVPFIPSLGGKGFANGGNPPIGKASLVGEKGPELFIPSKSGTIIPNHALGGSTNVVVNVDASGSAVQGDDDKATKFGEAIAAAVQAEIVNQKMAGGLLR